MTRKESSIQLYLVYLWEFFLDTRWNEKSVLIISCWVTNHPKVKITVFLSPHIFVGWLGSAGQFLAGVGVIKRLYWTGCSRWLIHITGGWCWLWARNPAGAVTWNNYLLPLRVAWAYHNIMAEFWEAIVPVAQVEAVRLFLTLPQHSHTHFHLLVKRKSRDQSRFKGKRRIWDRSHRVWIQGGMGSLGDHHRKKRQ